MRLSLKAKFYLLILPSVIVILFLASMLMVPHSQIGSLVDQVEIAMAEAVSAEAFARHYERQLRECASFVATGVADYEQAYEEARKLATGDLGEWMTSEKRHAAEDPDDRPEQLAEQGEIEKAYREVNRDCDQAIALSRSGEVGQALESLEATSHGPSATLINERLAELVPEEEEQLQRYLQNLYGSVTTLTMPRLLGLGSTVESMEVHSRITLLAEQFAKCVNTRIFELHIFMLSGHAPDLATYQKAGDEAEAVFEGWENAIAQLKKPADRSSALRKLDDIKKEYSDLSDVQKKALALAAAGDLSGAKAFETGSAGPTRQKSLTELVDRQVSEQRKLMSTDARDISRDTSASAYAVGIICIVSLGFAIGGTFLLSRAVVAPVLKLRDAAEQFGEGDLDIRVDIDSRDEIGELAASFNKMADGRAMAEKGLEKARDELEDRVGERTHDLEEANEELQAQIEERQRAEERLLFTQFAVDHAMDQICWVNSSGRIVAANDAFCAAHGYTMEEQLAMSIQDINPGFPREEWPAIWGMMKEAGTFRLEVGDRRKDGGTIPLEINLSYFEFGGEGFLVSFGRDITERRIAAERQSRLTEELVNINRELTDFAYVISHDLKAPLRGIGSLASWLKTDYADRLDEQGKEQLDLLLDRAKRMERLIEGVLHYSRVGRKRESRELVDLNELAAGAVEMVGPPESIIVEFEGELPVVPCERTRISQVFGNLISNAVKYMGKPEGRIIISCEDDGEFWKLAVADNGPGIDPKYHDRIFQIFQTLSTGDDVIESTGIGLTLVRKIVEMNGGRAWVESEAGSGATFFFTLPKEPDDPESDTGGESER